MESEIEKALKEMNIAEEDTPYILPDLPQYSSCKRNVLSIMGRTLNPPYQPMEDLIMDMPRKFRVQGRCRGIALSKERFQFIFKYKEDMDDVLDKGAWTFNDWSLILEPWKEHPPEDFLKYLSVWVQIRNLPVNYYSPDAIMDLGKQLLGFVKEVPFDPSKHQLKDYVRVKVLFDVTKQVRRAKVVDFPNGESVKLLFDFERVQKRCYACQRLTHDKASCPYLRQDRPPATVLEASSQQGNRQDDEVMSEQDPLSGVLTAAQLGVDGNTGRPWIAKEVLAWMRQYISVDDAVERNNRMMRLQKTVAQAEQDPMMARKMLQLEAPPIIHKDLNRGKGIVFNFEAVDNAKRELFLTETGRWFDDKLRELFFPGDIRLIKKMKPVVNRSDFWIWEHNKNGVYSVKSGNWLGNRMSKTELLREVEAKPSLNPLKAKIWDIGTAPKIRIFLWRAISGALPAAERLQSRGMVVDSRCPVCGSDNESINHILFTCSTARQVWGLSGVNINIHESSIYVNFNSFLELYGNKLITKEIRQCLPWILWILWKNRNMLLFEGRRFLAFETMLKVKADSHEWSAAQAMEERSNTNSGDQQNSRSTQHTTSTVIWLPPSVHWYKCDVSVSGSKKKRICGSAWIVRDHHGMVILHSRRSFSYIDNFVDAQHISLMWAIESMTSHGLNNIQFAMDARELVGVFNKPRDWLAFQGYGTQLKQALSSISEYCLTYASHDETRCAFLLARSANVDLMWRSYVSPVVPLWLRQYIELDQQRLQQRLSASSVQ